MRLIAPELELVRKHLAYDGETGVFAYITAGPNRQVGRVAGSKNKVSGYVEVGVLGKKFYAHQLAIFMTSGVWPAAHVDHINGDRSDNRAANLRVAHGSINHENVRKPKSQNTSGYLGVSFCQQTQRWVAQITVKRKHRTLGRFDTPAEAHAAYIKAKRRLHDGCTL